MTIPPIGVASSAQIAAPAAAAPPGATFGAVLRAHAAAAQPSRSWAASARAAVAVIDEGRRGLDAALAAARAGRTFKPQELLALQADAYRYSQRLELASRVIEQGAQSLKQAVNTQI